MGVSSCNTHGYCNGHPTDEMTDGGSGHLYLQVGRGEEASVFRRMDTNTATKVLVCVCVCVCAVL